VKEAFNLAASEEEFERAISLAEKVQQEIEKAERADLLLKKKLHVAENLKVLVCNQFSESKVTLNSIMSKTYSFPLHRSLLGKTITLSREGNSLDVEGGSDAQGTTLILWPSHTGPNQRFKVCEEKEDWYSLEPQNALGKRVDVMWGNFVEGNRLHIWECNHTDAQLVKFNHTLNGRCVLEFKNGFALTANEHPCIGIKNGGDNQNFEIKEV